jgi:hypothetical protein
MADKKNNKSKNAMNPRCPEEKKFFLKFFKIKISEMNFQS